MLSVLRLFRTILCLELLTTYSLLVTTNSDMVTPSDDDFGEITTEGNESVSTILQNMQDLKNIS
jgi:hypothetical protein